ncbi:MAG: thioesterase family protein [candidate division Zixibacteria bacterium]|nr:thioesterase family protein [candidate division Zixibacteria bacterium]
MAFKIETTVKLYDTDAAGIMFFGNDLRVAHDAYQAYMESCGFSFAEALAEGKLLIPVVHAEADYMQPLVVGDKLTIELTAAKISMHSFVLKYQLCRPDSILVATVSTVHVTTDRATNEKIELPVSLRQALERIFQPE